MEIYNKLKDLYEEICSIYRNLYNLDNCGYKNNYLFTKKVEVLKLKLEEEDKLVNALVQSIDYDEIREEIFSYHGSDNFYFRMKDSLVLYESANIAIFIEDDEELVKQKQTSMNVCKIYNTSAKNIFLVYASFLQMTIDKLIVKGLTEKLLWIKYYNCIIKRNMEKVMLQFDFCVPNEVYTDLNLIVDMILMDDAFCECVILDSYVTSIENSIEQLMSKTDGEYASNESFLASSLNYQCMLKACFAMMGEREYRLLEDKIIGKIKTLVNDDNVGSVENIIDIINNRKEYRCKVRKLSIKPLKYD